MISILSKHMREGTQALEQQRQRTKLFWQARTQFIRTVAQHALAFDGRRAGGEWEALRDAAEYWEREQLAQVW